MQQQSQGVTRPSRRHHPAQTGLRGDPPRADCSETPRFHHHPSTASAQSSGCISNYKATAEEKKMCSKQAVQLRTGPRQNLGPKYYRSFGKKFWNKHLHLGPNSAAVLNRAMSRNTGPAPSCPPRGSKPVTPVEISALEPERVTLSRRAAHPSQAPRTPAGKATGQLGVPGLHLNSPGNRSLQIQGQAGPKDGQFPQPHQQTCQPPSCPQQSLAMRPPQPEAAAQGVPSQEHKHQPPSPLLPHNVLISPPATPGEGLVHGPPRAGLTRDGAGAELAEAHGRGDDGHRSAGQGMQRSPVAARVGTATRRGEQPGLRQDAPAQD